jgi:alkylation response protein AidB-like acyl-CoA dehydrogenase
MAKLFVCESATRMGLNAQNFPGAYGHTTECEMRRYVRDAASGALVDKSEYAPPGRCFLDKSATFL